MISYSPLVATLSKKNISIYKLQDMLRNYNLRANLNSGRYLDLKTVDKICKVLKCNVSDVMEYKDGEQVIKDIVRKKYYNVNWAVVHRLIEEKGMSYSDCSVEMGKYPGYLTHLTNLKKVTYKTAVTLSCYFEKDILEITVP